ncbi:MAG: hypothetical protein Q4E75_00505 [bacterium]|nr:hypothetical protein [bacterium]
MMELNWCIYKKNNLTQIKKINYKKLEGIDFTPKNKIKNGINVNKILIIKPSMVEKILKKKINRKLDLYLKLIVKFIESDDSGSDDTLREALNDLSRYKSIVEYKYKKYLDQKYLKYLSKKIAILEYELNSKLINFDVLEEQFEEEKTSNRRR